MIRLLTCYDRLELTPGLLCFRWFCHFDDDNYVNTARLGELLSSYSAQEDWYLGKNSIRTPLKIMDRAHNGVSRYSLS